ncbi:histone deacetylase family protein [Oceanibaculum nanhaiense]|uniref:histone deacetylase family protein n=1 Tax=Oceanibaculum nanhaiense TaxID=1909734 RepID=UPI000A37A69E|nr:histone deacetylase family protein [Oceanibaculum nanhaiense]MBC7137010.1 histone deacetylase family protein [Oceanibaculum nanhaiense]
MSIPVFYAPQQERHDPRTFIFRGQVTQSPEQAERAHVFLKSAKAAGHDVRAPEDRGEAPIRAIHDDGYVDFLKTAHADWSALPNASAEITPNVHPSRHMADTRGISAKASIVSRVGYYTTDTACPIGAGTWEGVYWSAQSALAAASHVEAGASAAYALCRPPGHHAYHDLSGGFCFLNNSAIAAQALLAKFGRVAILDVDVHHGNGTQGIFYGRDDVLTVSLHGDPTSFYPWYTGFDDERGEGIGTGCNLNIPLPQGTSDDAYLEALEPALAAIRAFQPGALVVALGLDASEADPLRFFHITTPGFGRIASTIAGLGLPSVLVQEGGYPSDILGDNLASFLKGFGAR